MMNGEDVQKRHLGFENFTRYYFNEERRQADTEQRANSVQIMLYLIHSASYLGRCKEKSGSKHSYCVFSCKCQPLLKLNKCTVYLH